MYNRCLFSTGKFHDFQMPSCGHVCVHAYLSALQRGGFSVQCQRGINEEFLKGKAVMITLNRYLLSCSYLPISVLISMGFGCEGTVKIISTALARRT